MKYRVTEKHPYIKKDLIIKELNQSIDYGHSLYQIGTEQETFPVKTNNEWLNFGWIEEIQDPEYTRLDMLESFNAGAMSNDDYRTGSPSMTFSNWIKEYKNEK